MKKVISLLLSIVMLLSITSGVNFSASAATNPYSGGYSNCTWYAWQRTYDKLGISLPNWGNAKNWYSKAKGAGYPVSLTAKANYIVVYGPSSVNSYGHVAYVESVSGKTMTISEGGYLGGYNKRSVSVKGPLDPGTKYEASLIGFINPKKNSQSATTIKITFNGNGGTPSATSLNVTSGKTMGSNIPTAVRNGYTFMGWYTAAQGGSRYNNATQIASKITLYAHWINNQYALKLNRIYRIYNYKSKLPLQTNGSGAKSLVRLQNYSNTNSQLWRVSLVDSYGYYQFKSMYGGNVLDVDISSNKYDNGRKLQVYTPGNGDSKKFSLIKYNTVNNTALYSIQCKATGRGLDATGAATSPGTQIQQYYCNGSDQQLFYFVEATNRNIQFYDNLSNNYLPTPREVYTHSGGTTPKDCYISRNTDYVTTSVNAPQNKLIINQKKSGSSGKDMTFSTTVNGSYNYDMYDSNTHTMYLKFTAKSSVQGAKMYFRWGYDSPSDLKSITLNTYATNYIIEMPRTLNSGSNIHPYIDKACIVELSNIQLTQERYSDVNLSSSDTFNHQNKDYNINSNNGKFAEMPKPSSVKQGYIFDGWYTDREGGNKVTENSYLSYNTKLYAHWVKATDDNHTHNLVTLNKKKPTCTQDGSTGYSYCTICEKIVKEEAIISAYGHNCKSNTQKATINKNGSVVTKCSVCGTVKSKSTIYYPKTIKLSATNYTYNGKVKTPTVTVKDSKGKTLKKNTDYTVTYAKGRKNVGKYTVTIKFKGNYSGTVKKTFTIKPKATSISKLTTGKKKFTVKWKKQSTQTTGYQIQYSTSSKFKSAKTVTIGKNKATSKTISKLKAKKKYYVRIRTYKTVKINGKNTKIYSSWSKAKSIKTNAKKSQKTKKLTKKLLSKGTWRYTRFEYGEKTYYEIKFYKNGKACIYKAEGSWNGGGSHVEGKYTISGNKINLSLNGKRTDTYFSSKNSKLIYISSSGKIKVEQYHYYSNGEKGDKMKTVYMTNANSLVQKHKNTHDWINAGCPTDPESIDKYFS